MLMFCIEYYVDVCYLLSLAVINRQRMIGIAGKNPFSNLVTDLAGSGAKYYSLVKFGDKRIGQFLRTGSIERNISCNDNEPMVPQIAQALRSTCSRD